MKTEIQKTFSGFSESRFAEMRALVQRAKERGWIRFPAPSSDVATVRLAIQRGWIRFGGASDPAALTPGTPAKVVKTRTGCRSALSAKRH
jgi:hypothetical protein